MLCLQRTSNRRQGCALQQCIHDKHTAELQHVQQQLYSIITSWAQENKLNANSTCGPCMIGLSFSHAAADHQTSSPQPGLSAPRHPKPLGLGSPDTIRSKQEAGPSKPCVSAMDNPCPRQRTTAAGSCLYISFFKMFANRATYFGA